MLQEKSQTSLSRDEKKWQTAPVLISFVHCPTKGFSFRDGKSDTTDVVLEENTRKTREYRERKFCR